MEHAYNNNIITVNLLEAIRRSEINPVVMICSTSEVYGSVSKKYMPINEKQKIAPINPYAVTKSLSGFNITGLSKIFWFKYYNYKNVFIY